MSQKDWTDIENDLIVAQYFGMLADDLVGRPYIKAAKNREMQQRIARTRGSIEFKHQNISAVLVGLGEAWISGYKPRFNFQMPLAEAVDRWLSAHGERLDRAAASMSRNAMAEEGALFIGPSPTLSNQPPPNEMEKTLSVAWKFDVAARDERNRALGRAGEERVVLHERITLREQGLVELAENVRWVSVEDGDGAGFDISSFNPDGSPRLIEVKTTNGAWDRTPFHLSRNEIEVANDHPDEWRLVRVWNFRRKPQAFELAPPLERHVSLIATSFEARFN